MSTKISILAWPEDLTVFWQPRSKFLYTCQTTTTHFHTPFTIITRAHPRIQIRPLGSTASLGCKNVEVDAHTHIHTQTHHKYTCTHEAHTLLLLTFGPQFSEAAECWQNVCEIT
eukprot:Gregarina_sp_Pseudo_9__2123@NODE_2481_length_982_cov_4_518558_g2283_i0_p4_GENE_NODE_2481_length_982_cov_4_518558_g2283_i0NODE_2481_length_982_cov_4_518558_g2283_i0_p4_ORF_typecomplete_len114_score9_19_NODE_2481_length_982_cov_4_518558_g2283_i0640981